MVGHAGDGNFHILCVIDPKDPAKRDAASRFAERTIRRALRMSGTCTGEHGIGIGKMKYLAGEFTIVPVTARAFSVTLPISGLPRVPQQSGNIGRKS